MKSSLYTNFLHKTIKRSNVTVEWLPTTQLPRVRAVLGSNLRLDAHYPDWIFSWSSSVYRHV